MLCCYKLAIRRGDQRAVRMWARVFGYCVSAFALLVVVAEGATLKWSPLLQAHLVQSPIRGHQNVDPEVFMDSTELITSKGYPCENHYVTTQDGFILNMQRIPHGRQPTPLHSGKEKPVVIIQHGLEASSSNWLDNLVNESLGYLLADAGADVWLGNVRGNMYSRNHTYLKPDQEAFWAWSWDQMAALDLPAMVDHVVQTTRAKQVHYIGHSQGTLMGFAGFSTNRTLASLIKRFYALAPVARVGHIKSPLRLLSPFAKDLVFAFDLLGHYEFLKYNKQLMDFLAVDVCMDLADELCQNFLFILGGFDRTHLNEVIIGSKMLIGAFNRLLQLLSWRKDSMETRIPVYVAHNPGGTSVQNLLHFAQGVNSNAFQKFDYGSVKANMDHYRQPTPPQYNLSNFHVPVVTYAGGNDYLADPTDVDWLLHQIAPSLLANITIPSWEHLDFIWAFDAPKYCYDNILDWIFNK